MPSLKSVLIVFSLLAIYDSVRAVGLGGGRGTKVGGRTPIEDVKSNKEVQELGKFSVLEYNRQGGAANGGGLTFREVIQAEKQVVSGIKYYLKIEATQKGAKRLFDSVVVVKPWERSKQLLNFSPSTNY